MDRCIGDSIYSTKKTLTTAPVLLLTWFNCPFVLKTDAYNHAIGAVLLQHAFSEGSPLLPVVFYSKTLNTAEQKCPVHDHKMLATIQAWSKWNYYLINEEVMVYTNHKSLQYLQMQPMLNAC